MIVQTPATRADWHQWLMERGITHPVGRHRVVLRQIAFGGAWAFRHSDTPINPPLALAGILHMPDLSECWIEPGREARHCMPALVLAFRRQIEREARAVGRIVARVKADNRDGQRLVAALGFEHTGTRMSGAEVWQTREKCLVSQTGPRRPFRTSVLASA